MGGEGRGQEGQREGEGEGGAGEVPCSNKDIFKVMCRVRRDRILVLFSTVPFPGAPMHAHAPCCKL